ncbi:hypothetical protein [Peribacillus kribbensis]|uniref:hypothetical protein n=1 Tax=Peribacillus kribbensis TaxID=356658 RepID=UPI000415897E|nr:hypothetical protein [Peribacillus kribbensis]
MNQDFISDETGIPALQFPEETEIRSQIHEDANKRGTAELNGNELTYKSEHFKLN